MLIGDLRFEIWDLRFEIWDFSNVKFPISNLFMNIKINYKKLRAINPEAARVAVLDYLSSNGGNVMDASKAFGVQRNVIYAIKAKQQAGSLKDSSKTPKKIANKTSKEIEERILEVRNSLHYKPKQLSYYLQKFYNIDIPVGTIRGILRRNRI